VVVDGGSVIVVVVCDVREILPCFIIFVLLVRDVDNHGLLAAGFRTVLNLDAMIAEQ